MFERLKTMLRKEFIQLMRDPKMRSVIFIVPAIQIFVFGYAVNYDVRHISTAVYDLDRSSLSRDLVARLVHSGYFDIASYAENREEIRRLMDAGKIKAAFVFNPGFEGILRSGKTAPVQIIVDGTDANSARIVLSHAVKIAATFGEGIRLEQLRMHGMAGNRSPVELESRAWFNENLESRNYYVPGVMAQMVLIVTMMLSSMSVVREKEIGTMEQVIVTPIRRWEFILGKTIPFAAIGYINVSIVTVLSVFWFRIPFRGNLLLLLAATGLFLLSTLGFGLMISTISTTQQQAMMSSFMFTFPAMLLSGFAFPIENMPVAVQYMTLLNPLRYYLRVIRVIFLKGAGAEIVWPELLGLFLLGAAVMTVAVRRFRKTVT